MAHLAGDGVEELAPRRVLDQADKGFDVGRELHLVMLEAGFVGRDRRQPVEEGEVGQADQGAGLEACVHEVAAAEVKAHGSSSWLKSKAGESGAGTEAEETV